ncbi:polyhydroxybutyrate depolymerase [Lysobacter sp. yr284]|uniref:alpha/beta hydrolase family esterase n=1 Tax=Lysobacter sp. yr284 TaxID=1761791 RepID=UPI00089B6BC4|nr:hypothetical protein [Lysobacter sp. yr284]SDY79855.1 polyhydroxybutyrate depolymerase [Lysobacter sp. yr284]
MRSPLHAPAILALLAVAGLPGPAPAADPAPPSGQRSHVFSDAAGGERSYYVALPANYDRSKRYRLVMVFAGTDTRGREMHEWFGAGWRPPQVVGLEPRMHDTVFVYPDQAYAWGDVAGWALGPKARPYDGWHDIRFAEELLAQAERDYSIDTERVFATGHSWGGDMAAVVGCYLGAHFRAIAPVAANRPYWFGSPTSDGDCTGMPAVWTFFGRDDDHFGDASPDGLFGEEHDAFWTARQQCSRDYDRSGETRVYRGCKTGVRFTLYAGGQYSGGGGLRDHQPPDYFLQALSQWLYAF